MILMLSKSEPTPKSFNSSSVQDLSAKSQEITQKLWSANIKLKQPNKKKFIFTSLGSAKYLYMLPVVDSVFVLHIFRPCVDLVNYSSVIIYSSRETDRHIYELSVCIIVDNS